MTNEQIQALKAAAEKAIPAIERLSMMPSDELFDYALLNEKGDVDIANNFTKYIPALKLVISIVLSFKFPSKTTAPCEEISLYRDWETDRKSVV